jgi:hypothetical protein
VESLRLKRSTFIALNARLATAKTVNIKSSPLGQLLKLKWSNILSNPETQTGAQVFPVKLRTNPVRVRLTNSFN